ncbi:MAG: membrane protein insertase YidC [Rhodobacterales bacterium]|nr:membrane protein insertase YidC [Rhodobacterales bacterium]
MDDQNKNLIFATALSFIVIMLWFVLFPAPDTPPEDVSAPATTSQPAKNTATEPGIAAAPDVAGDAPEAEARTPAGAQGTAPEVADAPRVEIDTPSLKGSLSLQGGRIDQLSLKNYHDTIDPDSDIVELLSPIGSAEPYYALFGWAPGAGLDRDLVPGANTLWKTGAGAKLTPDTPVIMTWDNGAGLQFTRTISVDDKFMFDVQQSVRNESAQTVSLAPYGILARHGMPQDLRKFFILHEGGILMADGRLTETDYDDFDPSASAASLAVEQNGWVGFTDQYWMTTLIPRDAGGFNVTKLHDARSDIYQTTTRLPVQTVAPGESASTRLDVFAGAKEWETIRRYQNEGGIDRFVDSIDWGWFFFLTKPIFAVLHYLNKLIGNMGWAIIGLTLMIKALMLPLAYKSYVSMARMKELQPKMEKLKEEAGDDKQKMQKSIMELYKREKVNPASGCLPILLQVPIFFSLYKVIFVTLELRHAPWIGWIRDLSAPDPSSVLNLFGLLPYATPSVDSPLHILSLGVLPILLGISMWLQQKLNPTPQDATQKMIFAWMPWVFMFMLGRFASGLVLYWIANNTITFTQQYAIMRSQGYKPDVFGNIRDGFKRKPKTTAPAKTPKGGK